MVFGFASKTKQNKQTNSVWVEVKYIANRKETLCE